MYNILCTCPPMILQSHRYTELYKQYNINITIPNFTQTLSEDTLCELLPKYDGWIIGDDNATYDVLFAGKQGKLKAVIKWGVGTDNVDFKACNTLNIPVSNTPHVFGEEVSDIAIGYMLCLARKLHQIHNGNLKNEWLKPSGSSLLNKKVCLVGFGDIGQSIARKLIAFNMDIWVSDPAYSKSNNKIISRYGHGCNNKDILSRLDKLSAINMGTLDKCMESADYIICSCPLNDKTLHLINKSNITKCNKGVKIINVGRGPVINELDIYELLETGFIDSIGFDVFEKEPLDINNPLRKYPQNIFGSHNGSNTIEAVDKVSKIAIQKIFDYLNGDNI